MPRSSRHLIGHGCCSSIPTKWRTRQTTPRLIIAPTLRAETRRLTKCPRRPRLQSHCVSSVTMDASFDSNASFRSGAKRPARSMAHSALSTPARYPCAVLLWYSSIAPSSRPAISSRRCMSHTRSSITARWRRRALPMRTIVQRRQRQIGGAVPSTMAWPMLRCQCSESIVRSANSRRHSSSRTALMKRCGFPLRRSENFPAATTANQRAIASCFADADRRNRCVVIASALRSESIA
mmetsp:Transcript_21302/g.66059  ORF Transcript_21302/g.66059 Transcript_21302/m.66059 type:complete len:237 (+) Transcript_21302:192-902(+)